MRHKWTILVYNKIIFQVCHIHYFMTPINPHYFRAAPSLFLVLFWPLSKNYYFLEISQRTRLHVPFSRKGGTQIRVPHCDKAMPSVRFNVRCKWITGTWAKGFRLRVPLSTVHTWCCFHSCGFPYCLDSITFKKTREMLTTYAYVLRVH